MLTSLIIIWPLADYTVNVRFYLATRYILIGGITLELFSYNLLDSPVTFQMLCDPVSASLWHFPTKNVWLGTCSSEVFSHGTFVTNFVTSDIFIKSNIFLFRLLVRHLFLIGFWYYCINKQYSVFIFLN